MKKVSNNTMSVNEYLKLGAAAIGATTIIFFGIKTYKKLKNSADNRKETKDIRKEINMNNVQLSEAEAQSIADIIYTSLNTNSWDDTSSVLNALKRLKTIDDWKLVVIKFGKRKRTTMFSNVDGGIDEWFTDSFKDYEMYRVREILNKIGVTI